MKGLTAVIGIIVGLGFVGYGILNVGSIQAYGLDYSLPAILIVFGGTFGATLTSFTLRQFIKGFASLKDVIFPKEFPYWETIERFKEMADESRREGPMALQNYLPNIEDDLMRFGINQMLSGVMAEEEMRNRITPKLETIIEDSKANQDVFAKMGKYAPAFGMAGTLIGLIAMLATLKDPSGIGFKMATALITTLFGLMLANLVCLPLASRIAKRTEAELKYKGLVAEGVIGLLKVSLGRELEEVLSGHVPPEIPPPE